MAETCITVDQDQFVCSFCLDLLKDPVTLPCGHSFCMVCINDYFDKADQKRIYSCPQCRETFTPRPVLRRNNVMAEVVEKVKKTKLQAASPSDFYSGFGDVDCDFCAGTAGTAIRSCLVCLASFCETHLKPHLEVPGLKNHKLINASKHGQEKICSRHDKMIEIYCRTDQRGICFLCTMHEHKGHDIVAAVAERTEKQEQIKELQMKFQQMLQEKQMKVEDVKQSISTVKRSAQAAVQDVEKTCNELTLYFKKKLSEVTERIRDQEKDKLRGSEELLKKLEQEMVDLKRKNAELEQLSHTDDHIHFLQRFQSLCVSSEPEDSSTVSVHQQVSFDGWRKFFSDIKERLEKLYKEKFNQTPQKAAADLVSSFSEPKTREDFLKCMDFCALTLDPNTAHHYLSVSEKNRVLKYNENTQYFSDHPEKFDSWIQVLCKERMWGRCYWEFEWSCEKSGSVVISVTYKGIRKKGWGFECGFGRNNQSWGLQCFPTSCFWHNNIKTEIPGPTSSKIGVYVDHNGGTLSFYRVSDTMTLLHKVQITFTEPLYSGFWVYGYGSTVKLCDLKLKMYNLEHNKPRNLLV